MWKKQDNHHYANPQCGSPFSSLPTGPYDPSRIGLQGEFGGIGHNVSAEQYVILTRVFNLVLTHFLQQSLEGTESH